MRGPEAHFWGSASRSKRTPASDKGPVARSKRASTAGGAIIRAAIVGGTGYGGMELLRYLLDHPRIRVTAITSRTETGKVGDIHPHLRGLTDLAFTAGTALRDCLVASGADVTWQPFDQGHEIPLVVWRTLKKFLASVH